MTRCVIYTRVSTAEQVDRTSLETQERVCQGYCEREDMAVVQMFTDRGESAKTADRPGLQDMLRFCSTKKNRIDRVVVYRLDRLARNNHDHAIFTATLAKYGTSIRSATEPAANDDDPTGRFMTTILSAVAQLDNEIRGMRSAEGMRRITERGGWAFQAPLGYLTARDAQNLPILVEDPDSGPLVRRLFEGIAQGTVREADACRILNDAGLRTQRGKMIHQQTVHYMLRNRIYCGRIRNTLTGGQVVKAAFTPLVSEALFDRTQAVLQGKAYVATPHKRHNDDFPLRYFVRCGACDQPLTGSFSKGRTARYPYYRCRNRKCLHVKVRKKDFEKAFAEYLDMMTMTYVPKLSEFRKRLLTHWQQLQASAIVDQQRCRDLLESKEKEQLRLVDKLVSGVVGDEVYQVKNAELDAEIATLRSQVHDAELADVDLQGLMDAADYALQNAERIWLGLSGENRVRFQRVIFPDGLTYGMNEGFGTAVTCPVFNVLEQIDVEKTKVVPLTGAGLNRLAGWLRAGVGVAEALQAA